MTEKKVKGILAITNVPVPYRVDFFNELNKLTTVTVLYEQTAEEQKHRSSDWFSNNHQTFENVFLKHGGKSVRTGDVIKELKSRKHSVALVMGYTKKSEMISIGWLRLHKRKYYLNVDGGFIKENESWINRVVKSFFIKGATGYLSTGVITDKYLEYYGAQKNRIKRVPFSSLWECDILERPVSSTDKKALREKLSLTENKIIISVGQFIYRKGFDVLLQASIGLGEDIGIYIIGSEPTEEYNSFKEKNQLTNVHFLGFKKKEELSEYYRAADLFVLPTREDIWGLVINEAMAFGLPIITTERCIAGVELVDASNGSIVPINNPQELQKEILRIIYNCDLEKMGASSLKKIRGYTIEGMASSYYNAFLED